MPQGLAHTHRRSHQKIVQPCADMQTGDFVEVRVVAKHGESMLQRGGRYPHVIGRNGRPRCLSSRYTTAYCAAVSISMTS